MPVLTFNKAQTFTVNKDSVAGAAQVYVSSVELFFKSKPNIEFNTSGVPKPGVSLIIVDTALSIPNIKKSSSYEITKMLYDSIVTTSDATIGTTFRFANPVLIDTEKEYAMLMTFDRDAEFVLWTSKQGDLLVGTNTISPGPSDKNIGRYFDSFSIDTDRNSAEYRYLSDTDLKFKLSVARFKTGNTYISSNTTLPADIRVYTPHLFNTTVTQVDDTFLIPLTNMEFFTYNPDISVKEAFVGGQMLYQNTVSWPGGRWGSNTSAVISTYGNTTIVANTFFPNGAAFSWNTVYNNTNADKWIVLQDTNKVNVRKIRAIINDRTIEVGEPVTFTNAAASFYITPIAKIDSFNKAAPFGTAESIIMATASTSNATVRFVNNTIEFAAINAGGTGYNNSDILYLTGFNNVAIEQEGGYKAVANIVTNTSGGITALYFSNVGAGFCNTSNVSAVIANSTSGNTTGNTSAGSGSSFVYTVGATLKTDLRANNNFRGINVFNVPFSDILPYFEIQNPLGSDYDINLTTKYKRVESANTSSRFAYYITENTNNSVVSIKMFSKNPVDQNGEIPTLISRSNEFNVKYSNGATNDLVNSKYSNGVVIQFTPSSNNDYSAVCVNSIPKILFSKYIINNDYTGEHGDRGNAWAKGLTTKIKFRRPSEDAFVYLTAYRPANTDIQVYARIHNKNDPEAFDDKDWTRLIPANPNIFSSSSDTADWIELTYSFGQYPNVQFTSNGSVFASNGSSTITGSGTSFNTEYVVGDLIRVYPVLQPNTGIIAVVNSVTNSTHLVINTPITNNSFLGTTLNMAKLEYKQQAFNYIMNENVVRYYNNSMVEFDTYDTMQIKVVLLSTTPIKIPRVDDIGVTGTSA